MRFLFKKDVQNQTEHNMRILTALYLVMWVIVTLVLYLTNEPITTFMIGSFVFAVFVALQLKLVSLLR